MEVVTAVSKTIFEFLAYPLINEKPIAYVMNVACPSVYRHM